MNSSSGRASGSRQAAGCQPAPSRATARWRSGCGWGMGCRFLLGWRALHRGAGGPDRPAPGGGSGRCRHRQGGGSGADAGTASRGAAGTREGPGGPTARAVRGVQRSAAAAHGRSARPASGAGGGDGRAGSGPGQRALETRCRSMCRREYVLTAPRTSALPNRSHLRTPNSAPPGRHLEHPAATEGCWSASQGLVLTLITHPQANSGPASNTMAAGRPWLTPRAVRRGRGAGHCARAHPGRRAVTAVGHCPEPGQRLRCAPVMGLDSRPGRPTFTPARGGVLQPTTRRDGCVPRARGPRARGCEVIRVQVSHPGDGGSLIPRGFAHLMVARRHVDLLRVSSALCPRTTPVR